MIYSTVVIVCVCQPLSTRCACVYVRLQITENGRSCRRLLGGSSMPLRLNLVNHVLLYAREQCQRAYSTQVSTFDPTCTASNAYAEETHDT